MTEDDIRNGFDAIFLSLVGIGDKIVEGIPYRPSMGNPYSSARLAAISYTPTGFARDCVIQWQGSYQINVNTPTVNGLPYPAAMVAAIRAAFPRGLSVAAGTNTSVQVMQTNAQPAMTTADWTTIPVVIQFTGTDP